LVRGGGGKGQADLKDRYKNKRSRKQKELENQKNDGRSKKANKRNITQGLEYSAGKRRGDGGKGGHLGTQTAKSKRRAGKKNDKQNPKVQ